MRKDHNHRHRLKRGHPFQVLRTTLSLGSTTSLVLERTAIGSCHRRRCLDRGRRNLKTPTELPAAALEQNKAPAVEPNEAQPAAAAAEPNKMSPAPASSVEPGKAPAVELNEAQPAASAVEPNKVSAAPDATVEPDKPPTVELNEVQPAAAAAEPNKHISGIRRYS